jgi:apolipoprotein N-acyltransferase
MSMAMLARLLYQNQTPYRLAFSYGTGLYLTGASWVYVSIASFGTLPELLAAVATLGFALFVAAFFALPFALLRRLAPTSPAFVAAFSALWLLGEWLRSWLLTGFPWLYAGYSLTDLPLASYASLGGVYLLGGLLAAAAATLALFPALSRRQRLGGGTAIALVVAAALPLDRIEWTEPSGAALTIALLQPDVDQAQKWSRSERMAILADLERRSEPLWGSDLVVWPEAAVPAIAQSVPEFLTRIDRRARAAGSALITGIPNYQVATASYYNSVLGLGSAEGLYNKARLVPFAEYIPLQSLLGPLLGVFELPMESMAYGDSRQPLLRIGDVSLASAICYEVVYPDLVAAQAARAGLLLTVSNDAWFNHTIAPAQHLQMARLRAREAAKPMIRATNNGISALIDRRGAVVASAPQYQPAAVRGTLQPRTGSTPFNRTGSWPAIIAALAICAILGLRSRRR